MSRTVARKGFTIVELLIVIVVIAILAAITVVAYSSIQTRSTDALHYEELKAWKKTFAVYAATYGQYPDVTSKFYCLGTNFPVGYNNQQRCRNYTNPDLSIDYLQSDNTQLMNELLKVSKTLPNNDRKYIGNFAGPWMEYTGKTTGGIIYNDFSPTSQCPGDTKDTYTGSAKLCAVYLDSL